jgi:hypothetical protein
MTFEGFNQSNHDAMACDHQRFAILHHRHNDEREKMGALLAESACLCVFYAVGGGTNNSRVLFNMPNSRTSYSYTVV